MAEKDAPEDLVKTLRRDIATLSSKLEDSRAQTIRAEKDNNSLLLEATALREENTALTESHDALSDSSSTAIAELKAQVVDLETRLADQRVDLDEAGALVSVAETRAAQAIAARTTSDALNDELRGQLGDAQVRLHGFREATKNL